MKTYDVAVVGGGNAGLCAAITARQTGASVLLLEQAPTEMRGGNSRHARNLRIAHDMPSKYWHGTYSPDEYWKDLFRVSAGHMDENLARLMIDESENAMRWMAQCGAQFQELSSGTRRPSRKTVFLLGGGKALLNAYYLAARRLGIDIRYGTKVVSMHLDGGMARSATAVENGLAKTIHAKAFVISSGNIQSDIDWLKRYWGDASKNFSIRGTPYNDGNVLNDLLGQAVAPVGNPARWHIVAVDERAPKFDGGIVTRIDSAPFGIVVDKFGRRFYDEGEIIGPEQYAILGDLVARRPDQIAYSIFDSKVAKLVHSSLHPPIQAPTIGELAEKLSLNPQALMTTISVFNATAQCIADSNGMRPEHTGCVMPLKSRRRHPIDTPPFNCFPLRPGITFNYLGVKVDENARMLMANGCKAKNLFAAGSIMAANILSHGSLAGIGMAIGTVFGRIAGQRAADYANHEHDRDSTPRH